MLIVLRPAIANACRPHPGNQQCFDEPVVSLWDIQGTSFWPQCEPVRVDIVEKPFVKPTSQRVCPFCEDEDCRECLIEALRAPDSGFAGWNDAFSAIFGRDLFVEDGGQNSRGHQVKIRMVGPASDFWVAQFEGQPNSVTVFNPRGSGASTCCGSVRSDKAAEIASVTQEAPNRLQASGDCQYLGREKRVEVENLGLLHPIQQKVGYSTSVARAVVISQTVPSFDNLTGLPLPSNFTPVPEPTTTDFPEIEYPFVDYKNYVYSLYVLNQLHAHKGDVVTGYVLIHYGGVSPVCPDCRFTLTPDFMSGIQLGDTGMFFMYDRANGIGTIEGAFKEAARLRDALNENPGASYRIVSNIELFRYDGTSAVSNYAGAMPITQLEAELEAATQ